VNAVELSGLAFGYAERLLFDGFNLEVAAGEFLGVIGPNGAGKSTLLKLMAGLLRPRRGSVRILERELRAMDGPRRRGPLALFSRRTVCL